MQVVYADPSNMAARNLMAEASEQLGYQSEAGTWRGWMAYYCRFRSSEFQPFADYIDHSIVRWAMRKFKRLRGHKRRAIVWLDRLKRKSPGLFVHWCGRGDFAVGTTGVR